MISKQHEWAADYGNVLRLGRWLDENGYFPDPSAMLGYFEKPWKWSDQYAEMLSELPSELELAARK